MKAEERERLEKFFENKPAIKLAYEFKERLCELLNRKHQTAKECKRTENNDETDEIRSDTRV